MWRESGLLLFLLQTTRSFAVWKVTSDPKHCHKHICNLKYLWFNCIRYTISWMSEPYVWPIWFRHNSYRHLSPRDADFEPACRLQGYRAVWDIPWLGAGTLTPACLQAGLSLWKPLPSVRTSLLASWSQSPFPPTLTLPISLIDCPVW